jgi:ATP-dependent Clp protease ATP-binding subunit ClpC
VTSPDGRAKRTLFPLSSNDPYVGYEEGGQLSEAVRRRPYSVVLSDEIEKAHPDVTHLLLQILEEGKITDSLGQKIDFRNTIIIMTSNVGAELIKRQTAMGFGAIADHKSYEVMSDKILEESKRVFKPEFLNRLDDMIVFHQLERNDLVKIRLWISRWQKSSNECAPRISRFSWIGAQSSF